MFYLSSPFKLKFLRSRFRLLSLYLWTEAKDKIYEVEDKKKVSEYEQGINSCERLLKCKHADRQAHEEMIYFACQAYFKL